MPTPDGCFAYGRTRQLGSGSRYPYGDIPILLTGSDQRGSGRSGRSEHSRQSEWAGAPVSQSIVSW